MNMELLPVQKEDLAEYMRDMRDMRDMREAFQKSATDAFPDCNKKSFRQKRSLRLWQRKAPLATRR